MRRPDYAKELRIYRAARKLSVLDASKEIGTSTATVSRAENGRPVSLGNYLKIMDWLGKQDTDLGHLGEGTL